MSCVEQQQDELEALQAIFVDELQVRSPTSLALSLFPEEEESSHVGVLLEVEFPPEYPDSTGPVISIKSLKGLGPTQVEQVLGVAVKEAEENVGSPVVFVVANAVKEWLLGHNVKQLSTHEEAVQRKLKAKGLLSDVVPEVKSAVGPKSVEEEEEEKVKHGTLFSLKSFDEWKAKFEAELFVQEEKEMQEQIDSEKLKRLTGKKFFELRAAAILGRHLDKDEKEVYWFDAEAYEDEDLPEDDDDAEE
jgi:hypothetical protein